uniref:VWFA domain-containing protein n=1 Tax=Oryza brachyantha TaxID=4533 RepID=J3MQ02_ORYBR
MAPPTFTLRSLLRPFRAATESDVHDGEDEPVESPARGTPPSGGVAVNATANDGALVIKTHCELPAIARSAHRDNFAVLVHVMAPSMSVEATAERAPVDLVTVLDVSGSMAGYKLGLLKRSMAFVIDNLGPGDRLSIVSFSCDARRVIGLTRMSDEGKASAKGAVESLEELARTAERLGDDEMCGALVSELGELGARVADRWEYEHTGRACMLAGINAHGRQRATSVQLLGSALASMPAGAAPPPAMGRFGAYETPVMRRMVESSRMRREGGGTTEDLELDFLRDLN